MTETEIDKEAKKRAQLIQRLCPEKSQADSRACDDDEQDNGSDEDADGVGFEEAEVGKVTERDGKLYYLSNEDETPYQVRSLSAHDNN